MFYNVLLDIINEIFKILIHISNRKLRQNVTVNHYINVFDMFIFSLFPFGFTHIFQPLIDCFFLY